jgi:hypothetical protein
MFAARLPQAPLRALTQWKWAEPHSLLGKLPALVREDALHSYVVHEGQSLGISARFHSEVHRRPLPAKVGVEVFGYAKAKVSPPVSIDVITRPFRHGLSCIEKSEQ